MSLIVLWRGAAALGFVWIVARLDECSKDGRNTGALQPTWSLTFTGSSAPPDFPQVNFIDQIPEDLDIIFSEVGYGSNVGEDNLIAINEPGIPSISLQQSLVATPGGTQNFSTTADTTAVPTPALLPGLLALGLGIARKRQGQSV